MFQNVYLLTFINIAVSKICIKLNYLKEIQMARARVHENWPPKSGVRHQENALAPCLLKHPDHPVSIYKVYPAFDCFISVHLNGIGDSSIITLVLSLKKIISKKNGSHILRVF